MFSNEPLGSGQGSCRFGDDHSDLFKSGFDGSGDVPTIFYD